jgi:ribose transport system substrate-binding protein
MLAGALTACSSGSSSEAASGGANGEPSGGGGTVAVNVGTATPIHLKKGPLHIGIFMNDTTNQWEQDVANSAKAQAEKYGWTADIITPAFDVQTQLNQVQTAAATHKYDAIAAVPVDGQLECNAFTKTLPQANVLVSVGAVQLCGKALAAGTALWQPGTLDWVGGTGVTAPYVRSWLNAAARLNPGPQKAVFVVGPSVLTVTNVEQAVVKQWQPQHPQFQITNFLNTDFTTPSGYQQTLTYLRAHPDTTVILSSYSPDLTRGVEQALKQLGLAGKIKVADSGASNYAYQELEAGDLQFTSPLFPVETGEYMVRAIKEAQDGQAPPRYVSDIPPNLGTPDNIPIITKSNMNIFKPEY